MGGGFLRRDIHRRLGSDIDEVKAHRFFKNLNWDKLMKKEVTPPFMPAISTNEMDTMNFDKTFTKLAPELTPPDSSPLIKKVLKEQKKPKNKEISTNDKNTPNTRQTTAD